MAAVHFVRVFGCFLVVAAAAAADSGFSVLYTAEANHLHALAAKELRRYALLTTHRWADLKAVHSAEWNTAVDSVRTAVCHANTDVMVVSSAGFPQPFQALQQFLDPAHVARVRAMGVHDHAVVTAPLQLLCGAGAAPTSANLYLVHGGTGVTLRHIDPGATTRSLGQPHRDRGASVLHAAYTFVGQLGVLFDFHADLVPDHTVFAPHGALPAPLALFESPTFSMRGLQPFHDFPEGPDWWSADMYKQVISNIAKLRMNFFGLHTYPYDAGDPVEPTVWVGLPDDAGPNGTVTSAYPSSYASTLRTAWGYTGAATSTYPFGASMLYERECFGSPVQAGNCPYPTSAAGAIQVFDATAALLRSAFEWGHSMGVEAAVGTQVPLSTPPGPVAALNVFYSASRDDHFVTTTQCDECRGLYTLQRVAGYVASTYAPGLVNLSTWYNPVLQDNWLTTSATDPPAPGYAHVRVEGYALPSSAASNTTHTHALLTYVSPTATDHYAVADAADAAAAAAAGYSAAGAAVVAVHVNGSVATHADFYRGMFTRAAAAYPADVFWSWSAENVQWDHVNASSPVWVDGMHDMVTAADVWAQLQSPFDLMACGWVVGPLPNRAVVDTQLPASYVATGSLEMDLGDDAVDPSFVNITRHSKFVIPWMEDDPGLTATELWMNRTLKQMETAASPSYNISGLLGIHWRTAQVAPTVNAMAAKSWEPALTSPQYWARWVAASFGTNATATARIAAVFDAVDSFNTPRPVAWVNGPGAMQCVADNCADVAAGRYAFVDDLAAMARLVSGDLNTARFAFWVHSLRYTAGLARAGCACHTYNTAAAAVGQLPSAASRKSAAQATLLPLRVAVVTNVTAMMADLLAHVSTFGEMGTVTNLLTHSVPTVVTAPGVQLAKWLQADLPTDAQLPTTLDAALTPRMFLTTQRTQVAAGEPLELRIVVLAPGSPSPAVTVTVYAAPLAPTPHGATVWTPHAATLAAAGRAVFTATLPSSMVDFKYYVQAKTSTGAVLHHPPGAPVNVQTVVVVPTP